MAKSMKYVLEGLSGCRDCAQKIEKAVGALAEVKAVNLDFVTKMLTLEVTDGHDARAIGQSVADAVRRIEPDVKLVENTRGGAGRGKAVGRRLIALTVGALLFLAALLTGLPLWAELGLFFAAYFLVGGPVLIKAGRNIARGQIFDENFLMTIATIGAFAIAEYPEGVAVMLFYRIGELFQDMAVGRSRRSIAALMDIRPDYANLKKDGAITRVDPEAVNIGDTIVVRPGERVPLDGQVTEGSSTLDTAALTGESLPRYVEAGGGVLSGSINLGGLLTVEVKKTFGDSTVARILDLVQNAGGRKSPTENFITKFARYYTPAVVLAAAAVAVLPPLVVPGAQFAAWLNRALVFLIVSCPCALVISIPLGFFGGIGGASKNGILIKGGNYLEALNNVDTVVFDKTGTLTEGVFRVTEIVPVGGISKDRLLGYAAHAESHSTHPIAVSIVKAYGKPTEDRAVTGYGETAGQGVKATVDGRVVLVGNAAQMRAQGIAHKPADAPGSVAYIAVDGVYAGHIMIADQPKPDSARAVEDLKRIGIKRIVMLSGDNGEVCERIGKQLGIGEVYAGLLPDQKVRRLELLAARRTKKGKLVFVGDGINDAPVLARADVGVAMGGLGSDAAIEAADVVLMTDEPGKLVSAIRIAKRTRNIVWQNIICAMGVKLVVLLLGASGIATMWEAVFADVGVAVLAVLNAMRVLRIKNI